MRDLKEYFRPRTADDAVDIKRQYGGRAVYLAGASDLLVHRPAGVEAAIDIRHAGISYVRSESDHYAIGGAALLRDVEREVGSLAGGMFGIAMSETAPWLIRNSATLAGNLANASPAADGMPALLALDAQLVLLDGTQEIVLVQDILVGPHRTSLGDRLIQEIRLPRDAADRRGGFIKLARSKSDIALVNIAVSYLPDGDVMREVRVAFGAVAPTAMRARGAETALEGKQTDKDVLDAAAEAVMKDVLPISDFRASESYRRKMCGVLLRRALEIADAGGLKH